VGALDSLGSRIAMLDGLDRIMALSAAHFLASEVGQMTFFGEATGVEENLELPAMEASIPKRRLLRWERELLGIYVSDHPLTPHLEDLARVVTHFSAELLEASQGQEVCVAGEVAHIRPYRTRSGREMGFVTIEDIQGAVELVVFSRLLKDVVEWLEVNLIVVAKGKLDRERGEPKVLVDQLTTDFEAVHPVQKDIRPPEPEERLPGARAVDEAPATIEPSASPEEAPPVPAEALAVGSHSDAQGATQAAVYSVGTKEIGSAPPSTAGNLPRVEMPLARPDPGVRDGDPEARMITVILESTGDRRKDALRVKDVHGLLTSYPGKDRFAFLLFEASRRYHLEFPNSTTGYCPELHGQLVDLLGEGVIRVEPLRYQ